MTRPSTPNAHYKGDIRNTIHNGQPVSLYDVLGRAWPVLEMPPFTATDDTLESLERWQRLLGRWYFQPILSPPDHSEANTYIVHEGSLEFL